MALVVPNNPMGNSATGSARATASHSFFFLGALRFACCLWAAFQATFECPCLLYSSDWPPTPPDVVLEPVAVILVDSCHDLRFPRPRLVRQTLTGVVRRRMPPRRCSFNAYCGIINYSVQFHILHSFHSFIHSFVNPFLLSFLLVFLLPSTLCGTRPSPKRATIATSSAMIFRLALFIALFIGFCRAGSRRGDGTAYSGTNQVRRLACR